MLFGRYQINDLQHTLTQLRTNINRNWGKIGERAVTDIDDDFDADQKPWKLEGLRPIDWFNRELPRFIRPIGDILRDCRPYADKETPACGGVYFLIHENAEWRRVVYVGLSVELWSRLRNHAKNKAFTHTYYITGIPDIFLKHVEAQYLQQLQPEFNTKGKLAL